MYSLPITQYPCINRVPLSVAIYGLTEFIDRHEAEREQEEIDRARAIETARQKRGLPISNWHATHAREKEELLANILASMSRLPEPAYDIGKRFKKSRNQAYKRLMVLADRGSVEMVGFGAHSMWRTTL